MSTLTDRETELLARPSLEALSYALRNLPRVLPEHDWHYSKCKRCAMQVAHTLWPEAVRYAGSSATLKALKLADREAGAIFLYATPEGLTMRKTQPHHVADAIDALLAERGAV